jgi:hypothetical protein
MSARETYTLAHTARCKLQIAADRPDRNLRFILGHAFTLDKLRLRIAEIEMDMEDEEDRKDELSEPLGASPRQRRVSFNNSARPSRTNRARSPPPNQFGGLDSSSDEDDFEEDDDREVDDEDDEGLSLQRFESGSARQPQMIDDDGEEEEEEELKSPPPMPSEDDLRMITGSEEDEELTEAYGHVAGCPCHGQKGPHASHVWEIPQKPGEHRGRYAIVAVEA